ncbi:Annexin A7, partial [Geodia barretti]
GLGTDESTLIAILCTRSNEEIIALRKQYKSAYGKDVEKDVASDTSGHFKRVLISLLTVRPYVTPLYCIHCSGTSSSSKDTPDMRTPHYYIRTHTYSHLTNMDTFFCHCGVWIRVVPL